MSRATFRLPDVGEGIAEAELVAWHVRPGQRIEEDAPLVEVMTDKATVEIPSPLSGTVVSVSGTPGDRIPIGSEIVVFELDAAAPAPEEKPSKPVVSEQAPEPEPAMADAGAPQRRPGKALAAPAVRERAQRLGLELSELPGSGPEGRVTHADLDRHLTGGAAPAPRPIASSPAAAAAAAPDRTREGAEEIKVIGLRRRIAERMQEANSRIPHFTYVEEVDVTALEKLRAALNAEHPGQPHLTVLPFLVRALARVVPRFPQINAHYDDAAGVLRRHKSLHVGIATQTAQGLMVPVLRHAGSLDLWQCAAGIAQAAGQAREGTAERAALTGSTITLSSLGKLGGIVSTPVINPPEVAILAVGRIAERPFVRGGAVGVGRMMNLCGSFDHRVVDGWDAASFVLALKSVLESPALLFVDPPSG